MGTLSDYPTDDQIRCLMRRLHQVGREISIEDAIEFFVKGGDYLERTPRHFGRDFLANTSQAYLAISYDFVRQLDR